MRSLPRYFNKVINHRRYYPDSVTVERTQHAVGQGGFHSCTIKIDDDCTFEYVFDCGTRSKGPDDTPIEAFLNQHIQRYQPLNNKVDGLFLSHLDIDHYNGAKQLCAVKSVSRIYLPYFTVDDILLVLATHDVEATAETADYLNELFAIARGRRRLFGVAVTVIGGSSAPEEGQNQPPEGDREQLQPVLIDEHGHLHPIADNLPNGATIGLRYQAQVLPWILRPWSYKQSAKAQEAMSKAIDQIPSLKHLKDDSKRVTALDLQAIKTHVSTLKKQCTDILFKETGLSSDSKNANTPSICLYSGPLPRLIQNFKFKYDLRGSPDKRLKNNPVGWITTGDCLMSKHWPEFRQCFVDVLTHVGTYVVPHHGAEGNHRTDFIDATPGRLAIICARNKSPHHPSKAVLECLHEVDDLWLVADEYALPIVEQVTFGLNPQR